RPCPADLSPTCRGHRLRLRNSSCRRSSEFLPHIKAIVTVIVDVTTLAFTRLAFRWQSARDAPAPARIAAANLGPLHGAPLLVHAHDEMTNDQIDHLQAAVDLFHQLAGAVDHFEDVGALLVTADLVGKLAPAPVLGLFGLAVHFLNGRL